MGAFITSCACAPLTKKSVTFATLILSLLHPTIHIPYNPWSDQRSFAKSRLLFTTLAQLPLTHLKTVSHATLQTQTSTPSPTWLLSRLSPSWPSPAPPLPPLSRSLSRLATLSSAATLLPHGRAAVPTTAGNGAGLVLKASLLMPARLQPRPRASPRASLNLNLRPATPRSCPAPSTPRLAAATPTTCGLATSLKCLLNTRTTTPFPSICYHGVPKEGAKGNSATHNQNGHQHSGSNFWARAS